MVCAALSAPSGRGGRSFGRARWALSATERQDQGGDEAPRQAARGEIGSAIPPNVTERISARSPAEARGQGRDPDASEPRPWRGRSGLLDQLRRRSLDGVDARSGDQLLEGQIADGAELPAAQLLEQLGRDRRADRGRELEDLAHLDRIGRARQRENVLIGAVAQPAHVLRALEHLHVRPQDARRHAQLEAQARGGDLLAALERVGDADHDRHQQPRIAGQQRAPRPVLVGGEVLDDERQREAGEDDEPAPVDPEQEQRDQGERAVEADHAHVVRRSSRRSPGTRTRRHRSTALRSSPRATPPRCWGWCGTRARARRRTPAAERRRRTAPPTSHP